MACQDCGSFSVIKDDCSNVCSECGSIQDSCFLVEEEQSPECSSFTKFKTEETGTKAYKTFKELYGNIVKHLKLSVVIEDEGLLFLSKLWKKVKLFHMETKKTFIVSMLFLQCRNHNIYVQLNEFCSKVNFKSRKLGKILKIVSKELDLPMVTDVIDLTEVIQNQIKELSVIALKNLSVPPSVKDTLLDYSFRLAKIIDIKNWAQRNNSRKYTSKVVVTSVIIAMQYALISSDKQKKSTSTRKAKFVVTKKNTIDYNLLAKYADLNARTVQSLVKEIQEKLFAVCKNIPWKPKAVTKSCQVGLILPDILNYLSYDIEEDDDGNDNNVVNETEDTHQNALAWLTKALVNISIWRYFSANPEPETQWYFKEAFHKVFKTECVIFKSFIAENKSDNVLYELVKINFYAKYEKYEINTLIQEIDFHNISKSKTQLIIGKTCLTVGLLELIKDLLVTECSIEEILNEDDYLCLVSKYLDDVSDDFDEILEPLTEEESFTYLKDFSIVIKDECDDPQEKGMIQDVDIKF